MSQPLFESLHNSSSPQEFISSIQEIINKNDPSLRVKEIIPIILAKKQLILENNNNKDQQQQMIQSVGELFLWIMPCTPDLPDDEREIEEEICAAAHDFCAIPEVEAFFLEVMLPNAFEEQAIYISARSVCRLTAYEESKQFNSFAAAKQLLEMATRAPTQLALEWTFQAMENATNNAEDSVAQRYVTEKNAKILLRAFQRAQDGECLENASRVLFSISRSNCDFSRICTQEFASAALEKLFATKSTLVVEKLCGFIANAAYSHPECCSFFCTEKATRIFLRISELVNDNGSAHSFSQMIANLARNLQAEPTNFATKEFCAAVVRCFDFATTDRARSGCGNAITCLTQFSAFRPLFSCIPNIVEKIHDAIKKMEDLNKANHLFGAIALLCSDEEPIGLFATIETLRLLVDSRKKVSDVKSFSSIDFALNIIVSNFPKFLAFCAAQCDVTSEYQQRLLKEVTTLKQLVTFLENDSGDFFEHDGNQIVKRRSLLIVFEKLDQFLLSREENNKNNSEENFQKFLSRICRELYSNNDLWWEILNHQFLDSVVFSLLQNAKGMTCLYAAFLIRDRIQVRNPPALSSSLIKVILEKLDEENEKSFFSKNADGDSFFSLGIQLVRHAVSKDPTDLSKTFFMDNSQLVKRVFEKGRFFGDLGIKKEIDSAIGEIEKFSPQTKGMF
jgi:hypothetical protein